MDTPRCPVAFCAIRKRSIAKLLNEIDAKFQHTLKVEASSLRALFIAFSVLIEKIERPRHLQRMQFVLQNIADEVFRLCETAKFVQLPKIVLSLSQDDIAELDLGVSGRAFPREQPKNTVNTLEKQRPLEL
jgi:hypothetical protein